MGFIKSHISQKSTGDNIDLHDLGSLDEELLDFGEQRCGDYTVQVGLSAFLGLGKVEDAKGVAVFEFDCIPLQSQCLFVDEW